MINEKEKKHISKFLSLVLRHKPELIGIQPDPNGWVDIKTLIQNAAANGIRFDMEILIHVVETNSKKRFAFNESFDKIRASQGHSIEVDLGYENRQPPEILYHGTAIDHVSSIMSDGLIKRSRQHVHLSGDKETAIAVGQRHGKPYVFEVLADKMYRDGFAFYFSDNGVWLTDHVPGKYLSNREGQE